MKNKREKVMTKRDIEIQQIRKTLLHQRDILLSEADVTKAKIPENNNLTELGDQATAEIDLNFSLRLKGRERQLLKKIDTALEKIDNGTYGICEACGKEIDIKRLQVRPVTTMCIECKTEQEEEERLRER